MPAVSTQLELYWHGPPVVYEDSSVWDVFCPSNLPELRPVSCAARVDEFVNEWYTRFSSYDRMLRVVAYVRRFIAACRTRVSQEVNDMSPMLVPQY